MNAENSTHLQNTFLYGLTFSLFHETEERAICLNLNKPPDDFRSYAIFLSPARRLYEHAFFAGGLYKRILLDDLLALGESQKIAMARAFASTQWPQFSSSIMSVRKHDAHLLQQHTELTERTLLQALNVLRRHDAVTKSEGIWRFNVELMRHWGLKQ